jgi:low temperature requirement protein LtrA
MELFFDLVFVALIGQLAEGLRTHATFSELGIFLALFASVWWTWVNLTFTSNIQSGLSRRAMAGFVLAAMAGVGVLAVAAPEAVGELAWLFAVGNAAVRAVLLALWVRRSWTTGLGARSGCSPTTVEPPSSGWCPRSCQLPSTTCSGRRPS